MVVRYKYQSYTIPFVCFKCRKSFKRPYPAESRPCPDCGRETVGLSQKFKPPKKNAIKEWTVVKFLVEKGFLYFSVYDNFSSVPYPTKMDNAILFAERYKNQASLKYLQRNST